MRTWTKILLILLLCSVSYGAQVIRYVDPDAAGGGTGLDWTNAYTSLSAWNAAEGSDLVTDGDYHTVYCRSSSGTDDTTPFTLTGWTTGAANYIEIIGSDFPVDGVWDDTKYVLNNNDSATNMISLREDYVRFQNIQIKVIETSTNERNGIKIELINESSEIRFDSFILKGLCSGTGSSRALYINDSDIVIKIYNTLIYGFISGSDTGFRAIDGYTSTCEIYNVTIYNCYYGLNRSSGTWTATNCAVGNCNDDFSGAITINYCCSDDGNGNNPQGPLDGNWDNEFVTPGSDFDLESGGNCVGNGDDNPGAGLYSDDIIGTARSSTWDIGAFEYVSGAPPAGGGQVIIISKEGTPIFNDWWQFYKSLDG